MKAACDLTQGDSRNFSAASSIRTSLGPRPHAPIPRPAKPLTKRERMALKGCPPLADQPPPEPFLTNTLIALIAETAATLLSGGKDADGICPRGSFIRIRAAEAANDVAVAAQSAASVLSYERVSVTRRFVVGKRCGAVVVGSSVASAGLALSAEAPRFVPGHLKTLFEAPPLALPGGPAGVSDFAPPAVRALVAKLPSHAFPDVVARLWATVVEQEEAAARRRRALSVAGTGKGAGAGVGAGAEAAVSSPPWTLALRASALATARESAARPDCPWPVGCMSPASTESRAHLEHLSAMLLLEEATMDRDLRAHDLFFQPLRAKVVALDRETGHRVPVRVEYLLGGAPAYLHVVVTAVVRVPGASENRPNLRYGDVVKLRLASPAQVSVQHSGAAPQLELEARVVSRREEEVTVQLPDLASLSSLYGQPAQHAAAGADCAAWAEALVAAHEVERAKGEAAVAAKARVEAEWADAVAAERNGVGAAEHSIGATDGGGSGGDDGDGRGSDCPGGGGSGASNNDKNANDADEGAGGEWTVAEQAKTAAQEAANEAAAAAGAAAESRVHVRLDFDRTPLRLMQAAIRTVATAVAAAEALDRGAELGPELAAVAERGRRLRRLLFPHLWTLAVGMHAEQPAKATAATSGHEAGAEAAMKPGFALESASDDKDSWAAHHPHLNAGQRRAVNGIVRHGCELAAGRPSAPLFVLFGPPGTGKTLTIVEAVLQLLRRDRETTEAAEATEAASGVLSDRPPLLRVLLCAPSEAAANVLCMRLAKHGVGPAAMHRLAWWQVGKASLPPELLKYTSERRSGNDGVLVPDCAPSSAFKVRCHRRVEQAHMRRWRAKPHA